MDNIDWNGSKTDTTLRAMQPGLLQDYYRQTFIGRRTRIQDVAFAVLDFETAGLDCNKDHIISIGVIEIHKLNIQLNTAWHQIIKTSSDMPQGYATG